MILYLGKLEIDTIRDLNGENVVELTCSNRSGTNEVHQFLTRSESLAITKHLIQQFGFTEEELRDGK